MYCCGSLGVAKLRYLIFGYNVTAYARKMIALKNLSEVFILDCIVIPTASNEDQNLYLRVLSRRSLAVIVDGFLFPFPHPTPLLEVVISCLLFQDLLFKTVTSTYINLHDYLGVCCSFNQQRREDNIKGHCQINKININHKSVLIFSHVPLCQVQIRIQLGIIVLNFFWYYVVKVRNKKQDEQLNKLLL